MHVRKLTPLVLICATVFVVGLVFATKLEKQEKTIDTKQRQSHGLPVFTDRSRVPITVGEKELLVEVVNTPESMAQGLSGRENIGADGMLFIFPQRGTLSFWMKDMQFDLDMVWIDEATVVDISRNVPKPAGNTLVLPTYSPKVPASVVLEIPAGKAAEWNITEGTSLTFKAL